MKLLLFVLWEAATLSWDWTVLCVRLWMPINAGSDWSFLISLTFPSGLFLNNSSSPVGVVGLGNGKLLEDTLSFLDLNFLKRKFVEAGEEGVFGVPVSEAEDNLLFPLGSKILNPLAFVGGEGTSSGLVFRPTCSLASLVELPFFKSELPTVKSSSSVIDPILSVLLLLVRLPK